MGKFDGKVLLELGTSIASVDIVKYAKSEGAYVIVTDYLPTEKSEAKQYADETAMISTLDVDALVTFAHEKKVDGIFCGISEDILRVVLCVTQKLNLPCYFDQRILKVLNNKRGLKETLRSQGLPVIEEYAPEIVPSLPECKFPLYIKPVDSSSSRGMSRIDHAGQFSEAYAKALSFSNVKDVLVERLMTCDDIMFSYFIKGGEPSLLYVQDRYSNSEQQNVGSICSAVVFPSKYTDVFRKTMDEPMRKFIHGLGYNDGILSMQAFVENGKIICYDPAARLTGGGEYLYLDNLFGVNPLRYLTDYQLLGKMVDENSMAKCNPYSPNKCACMISFSVKPCILGKVIGFDNVSNHPNCIAVRTTHKEGDIIDLAGTLQQTVARVYLSARSWKELVETIKEIETQVSVQDINGNDVLLGLFDPDSHINNLQVKGE